MNEENIAYILIYILSIALFISIINLIIMFRKIKSISRLKKDLIAVIQYLVNIKLIYTKEKDDNKKM